MDFKKKTLAGVATLFVKRAPGSGHHPLELCLDIHEAMTIADVACGPATLKTTRERFCDFGDRLTVTLPDEFVEGEIVLTYTRRAHFSFSESRRRRGCDDVDLPLVNRGGAAAATWLVRRGGVATAPRPRRG